MSPNQLFLLCTMALLPGLQSRLASAQAHHDPSGIRRKVFALSNPVQIAPTALESNSTSTSGGDNFLNLQGFDLKSLISRLGRVSAQRIDLPASLDLNARYDVTVTLPAPAAEKTMDALVLQALEDRFHLTATRLTRPAEVYVVSALDAPPASFRAARLHGESDDVVTTSSFSFRAVTDPGKNLNPAQPGIEDLNGILMSSASLDDFCQTLEGEVDRPVVNQTHLQGAFNFNLTTSGPARNDLLDQLRLKMNLVIQPANRTIEYLVFRPAGSEPPRGAQAMFVRGARSRQARQATDWDSWLSVSCQIEPASIPRNLCAKSGLPDQTPAPSAQAPRDPASRRSAP